MKEVTVRKDDLLKILDENRDAHRDIFERSVAAYYAEAVRLLEEHIARIRAGRVEDVYVSLPRPEDHTEDYNRVIRMVQMSIHEEITLDNFEFQSYVQDDWTWKREFIRTSTKYLDN